MIFCGHFGLPAGFDHDSLVWFDNDGGAFDARSRMELVACVNIRFVPHPTRKELRAPRRLWQGGARALECFFTEFGAATDGLNRYRFDHHLFLAIDEAKTGLVCLLESALHRGRGAGTHNQRGVRARVPNMSAHVHLYAVGRDALAVDFHLRVLAERSTDPRDGFECLVAKRQLDCLLPRGAYVSEPHAVS